MTTKLFLPVTEDAPEKHAAAMTKLPLDPQQWPAALYQKAVEVLPELAEYDLNIALDQQDMSSATALGAVLVSLKQAPSLDIMGQVRPTAPGKTLRIPILILRGQLYPLDLLVVPDSRGGEARTVPLTPRRLRAALFRSDIFQTTSQPPGPSNLAGLLYPSSRDTFYGGNSSINQKQASLLEDLLVEGADQEGLRAKVAQHKGFADNPAARPALEALLSTYEKVANVEWNPTALQILKIDSDTYVVKSANTECWEPRARTLSRAELIKEASPEEIAVLDTEGEILDGPETAAGEMAEEPEVHVISTPGVAKVTSIEGMPMVGLVLPSLFDLTGLLVPIGLFMGEATALAPEIYGELIDTQVPPHDVASDPSGYGFFLQTEGETRGTVPMSIVTRVTTSQGSAWLVRTEDGSTGMIDYTVGARKPFATDGVLHLPHTFRWMPLPATKVQLAGGAPSGEEEDPLFDGLTEDEEGGGPGSPVLEKKAALRKLASRRVDLRYHGADTWSVSGPLLEKVGGRYDLNEEDTRLLLISAGLSKQAMASVMVKAATTGGKVRILAGVEQFTPPASHIKAAQEKKASLRFSAPLPPGLDLDAGIKIAAEFQDGDTIDSLLGLSLLTPDNISTFVTHIVEMEKVQAILCDALLASRLGLKAFDESSLEKAVQGMEAAIEGTYLLRFQQGGSTVSSNL